jgi:hypothetical protein
MLEYNPGRRMSASEALNHAYFKEDPKPNIKYIIKLPFLAIILIILLVIALMGKILNIHQEN